MFPDRCGELIVFPTIPFLDHHGFQLSYVLILRISNDRVCRTTIFDDLSIWHIWYFPRFSIGSQKGGVDPLDSCPRPPIGRHKNMQNMYQGTTRTCKHLGPKSFQECFRLSKMTRYEAGGNYGPLADCIPQPLPVNWLGSKSDQKECGKNKETLAKMRSLHGTLSFKKADVKKVLTDKVKAEPAFQKFEKDCDLKLFQTLPRHLPARSRESKIFKQNAPDGSCRPWITQTILKTNWKFLRNVICVEFHILALEMSHGPQIYGNMFINTIYNVDLLGYPWNHG